MSLRPNNYRVTIGARIGIQAQGGPARAGSSISSIASIALPQAAEARIAVLDGVLAGLARGTLRRFDGIEVRLGFPYVRHMVLPWQDAILTPAERSAYAAAMLAEEYGFTPGHDRDWLCTLAQQAFGSACIASALRREVVDEIATAAKKQGLRLRAIGALLTDSIASPARNPGPLPADAVFVAAQPDACEFAFRRNAQWRHAFTLPRGGQSIAECLLSAALLAQLPIQNFPTHIHMEGADDDDADATI